MKTKRVVVGSLETNCYLLYSNEEIAVIDPGGEPEKILDSLKNLGDCSNIDELKKSRNLKFILATHCHWDHIGAVDKLREKFDSPFYIGEGESPVLENSSETQTTPQKKLNGSDRLKLGNKELKVLETPGHSPGSITLMEEEGKRLFVGDLIFSGGYGRTDLPGGSRKKLQESVSKLAQLNGDWDILPGHGPRTTLKKEMERSPFLNKAKDGQ